MTSTDVRPGSLLDPSLLRDTIHAALRTGGDFAEVFVEDRRSMSALFDDGRVEELTGGRSRGAGIRVVFGETTGFAHTAALSPEGLRSSADAASDVSIGSVVVPAVMGRCSVAEEGVGDLGRGDGTHDLAVLDHPHGTR